MSDIINMNVQFPRIKREEIRLISTVGHGSFGVVHHGFSLAVGHVAIKVCHSDSDQRKLAKEVENTIRVCASHPNIVKLFGTFDCPQNGLSIVFEYMSGGSLHDVILKRTDLVYCVDHIVSWVYQISSAMAHMHKCLIMHRDVKPENILMNELFTTVKLCDLGEARTLHDDHSTLTPGVGTYLFMAPEAMEEGSYTFAVDVYSLGMTIWMMFARRVPSFVKKFESVVAFINAIRNGLRPSKLPMLQIFNEMIAECLKNDPKERATITEVRDFAADLVQKFPFGSNFLVRLPDSQVLQEPINVRGDVQSGEDVATRPSPSKTLLPTPATRKPTPDSATPKARAETPRDVKRRDEDERKRQDERSRFLEEDRQRVECAVMLVEEERSREAERQRKQEYLEKLRAARQRARIEEEERQRQREMERLEVPREHKGRQSVTFDSNVEMHSPMPTCPEADDTFDGNFERITVQDNGEPGAERFELVEPNVTIVDELPHSSSKEMQIQKTLNHWYLNSIRIPNNLVKNRMKMFE